MGCQSSRVDSSPNRVRINQRQQRQQRQQNKVKVTRIDDEQQLEELASQPLKYSQILNELQENNEHYSDPDFPAKLDSIIRNKSDTRYKQLANSQWKRATLVVDEHDEGLQVFDGINPRDIKQGSLGVCYFLCSLSLLAEHKGMVKECFNTLEINSQGLYSLNFYIMGSKQEVLVDDQIPTLHNKVLFSRPVGHEIWVMLLEKAWCKLFKTYCLAEGGLPHVSMEYLTGAPTQAYSSVANPLLWKQPQQLAQLLIQNEKHQHLQAAGTREFSEDKKVNGIVAGHAYSILAVNKYKQDTIIKLRNPWGKTEFKGRYSEDKPIWQQDNALKKAFTMEIADDGIFYMTIEELCKYFDQVSVCYVKQGYKIQHVYNLNFKDDEHYFFKFKVEEQEGQEVCFRLHQMLKDMVQDKDYDYSGVQLRIFKIQEGGTLELLTEGGRHRYWGYHSVLHDDKVLTHFSTGEYLLQTAVHWADNIQRTLTCSVFSHAPLPLHSFSSLTAKQMLYDYQLSLAVKHVKVNKKVGLAMGKAEDDRAKLIYCRNDNKDIILDITFTIKKPDNFGFVDNDEEDNNVRKFSLNPGQIRLCRLEPLDYYQGYKYKMSTSIRQRYAQ